MTALSLTPPEFFSTFFSTSALATTTPTNLVATFLHRDMLSFKHLMHACFFWAGHANFWHSGNLQPMEICRILFFLTIFPSLVAFLTSVTNARVRLLFEILLFLLYSQWISTRSYCFIRTDFYWELYIIFTLSFQVHGIGANLIVATTGLILALFSTGLTWWSVTLSTTREEQASSSPPISTVRERLRRCLSDMPDRTNHPSFWRKRKMARIGIWLHVISICGVSVSKLWYTTNGTQVHYYVGKGANGVTTTAVAFEVFLPAYVEALSLALHWGFLFGCGLHGELDRNPLKHVHVKLSLKLSKNIYKKFYRLLWTILFLVLMDLWHFCF